MQRDGGRGLCRGMGVRVVQRDGGKGLCRGMGVGGCAEGWG